MNSGVLHTLLVRQPWLPSSGILGILTNINDFTPVAPEPSGTADVVVVGPDPDGISAAAIDPQLETVGGDLQDLSGKQSVLSEIDSAIQKTNLNSVFINCKLLALLWR